MRDGHLNTCKACKKDYDKIYNNKNREKRSAQAKKRYRDNKEVILAKTNKYYHDNKEVIKAKAREDYRVNKKKHSAKSRKYYEKNADVIKNRVNAYYYDNREEIKEKQKKYYDKVKNTKWYKERNMKYFINRLKNDELFAFKYKLRGIISVLYSGIRNYSNEFAENILGCRLDEFRIHIDDQLADGMTPDNYGDVWNLDYIVPLGMCETIEEVWVYTHYSNIQPMFVGENQEKKDKYIG